MYFDEGLETKASLLPPSALYPNDHPGKGLFTTIPRKAGDMLCRVPGYWMNCNYTRACAKLAKGDSYPLHPPEEEDGDSTWPHLTDLTYMTHKCPFNMINAGKIKDEAHTHTRTTPTHKPTAHTNTHERTHR